MKKLIVTLATGLALALLPGCGAKPTYSKGFPMGERVSVGPLTYVVLNSEWKSTLGEGIEARVPVQRFLVLHLTITNGSGADMNVPLLQIVDSQGVEHPEVQDGKGISGWMGLLRKIQGTQTEDGYIAFAVLMGPMRLKVTDAGDLENEKSALIEIPIKLEGEVAPTSADTPLTATPQLPAPNPVEKKYHK